MFLQLYILIASLQYLSATPIKNNYDQGNFFQKYWNSEMNSPPSHLATAYQENLNLLQALSARLAHVQKVQSLHRPKRQAEHEGIMTDFEPVATDDSALKSPCFGMSGCELPQNKGFPPPQAPSLIPTCFGPDCLAQSEAVHEEPSSHSFEPSSFVRQDRDQLFSSFLAAKTDDDDLMPNSDRVVDLPQELERQSEHDLDFSNLGQLEKATEALLAAIQKRYDAEMSRLTVIDSRLKELQMQNKGITTTTKASVVKKDLGLPEDLLNRPAAELKQLIAEKKAQLLREMNTTTTTAVPDTAGALPADAALEAVEAAAAERVEAEPELTTTVVETTAMVNATEAENTTTTEIMSNSTTLAPVTEVAT